MSQLPPDKVDTHNVQGDIYPSFPKKNEDFLFFVIKDPVEFKKSLPDLRVTSTQEVLAKRREIEEKKPEMIKMALLNIAFSKKGLVELGVTDSLNPTDSDEPFEHGQLFNARRLGDPGKSTPAGFRPDWDSVFLHRIDGLILVAGDSLESVNEKVLEVKNLFGRSIQVVYRLSGQVRPKELEKREHFGWRDGISNPYVDKQYLPDQPDKKPGPPAVLPGVLICGHAGDPYREQRPPIAFEGSFLAFRKLEQLVPEFHKFLADNPATDKAPPENLPILDPPEPPLDHGALLRGSRFVGRWPSDGVWKGASIQVTPDKDDPKIGDDPMQNNNFVYPEDTGDKGQAECPYSAHLRKTNPRTDLAGFKVDRARMLRAGIAFGKELSDEEKEYHITTQSRGLAFVAYQSALNKGFQFVQMVWANDPTFIQEKGVTPGFDPIIGQNDGSERSTMGTTSGYQLTLPTDFVVTRGGEYFFSPSISVLKNVLGAREG